jgi:integrase/recombinase XerD
MMKATTAFTSLIAPHVERYLTLKQALGREYDGVRRVLAHVDQFVTANGGDLTVDTFAGWCLTLQHLASGTRRSRMQSVRNFCLYRRRSEPESFVPDARLFPPRHRVVRPHLFTGAEIVRLLVSISALPAAPTSPFRRENLHLAIVLLYTTGLRLGELVRLKLGDYDPREHTLLIRESKFHKSRLVPLSIDGTREIDQYLAARGTRLLAISPESPLLWHHTRCGTAYTGTGLSNAIRRLLRATQIRTETGRLPRVHDFRHTFALQALLRWYRNGADVQAKLPLLATYMGHVSIASTEYYLKFVEPLCVSASERFARHCGGLVTTRVSAGGER